MGWVPTVSPHPLGSELWAGHGLPRASSRWILDPGGPGSVTWWTETLCQRAFDGIQKPLVLMLSGPCVSLVGGVSKLFSEAPTLVVSDVDKLPPNFSVSCVIPAQSLSRRTFTHVNTSPALGGR